MFEHASGPYLTYGLAKGATGVENSDAGPSLNYQGDGILDPRNGYAPGQATNISGFFNCPYLQIYNGTPAAASATNLANAVTPSGGVIALTAGTGTVAAQTVYNWATQSAISGVTAIAINEQFAPVTIGRVNWFDPTTATARTLQYKSSGADVNTVTVLGYDIYGVAMTETITLNGTTKVAGKKAFKWVASASTTSSNNISIGTDDAFGFHVRSDLFEQMNIFQNQGYISAATGYTAAVTTTATATTGDVRGTYAVQSASDGTKRLTMYITLPLAQLTGSIVNGSTTSMFGVAQF